MERPNLGKPFVPAMLNNLPDASVALPINSSYPKVASAVLSTPRHLPCEDVRVFPKEGDERAFLFVGEPGADGDGANSVTG